MFSVVLTKEDKYPENISFEALAIGAYFGGEIPETIINNNLMPRTKDQFLDSLAVAMPRDMQNFALPHIALADCLSMELIAYEGGEGFTAPPGHENDIALTDLLIESNKDEQMRTVFADFLNSWYNMGGALLNTFAFMGNYNNLQTYGRLFEHIGQDGRKIKQILLKS